ncbi:hypothetical protein DI53_1771 [Sphingobacterium deserti]|uniref:Uncharacterized protein n=1 Tax=Sphingobacterium deserti TaxID=1229276 RepID=A0A0B8T1F0_9SPHI|nr:hypothetical protein DI53_1771 [Sphingobacterium deserti]
MSRIKYLFGSSLNLGKNGIRLFSFSLPQKVASHPKINGLLGCNKNNKVCTAADFITKLNNAMSHDMAVLKQKSLCYYG